MTIAQAAPPGRFPKMLRVADFMPQFEASDQPREPAGSVPQQSDDQILAALKSVIPFELPLVTVEKKPDG